MEASKSEFLKKKMSIEEMDIQEPDRALVDAARAMVMRRKPVIIEKTKKSYFDFFKFELNVYQAGFAALLITFLTLYVSRQKYANNAIYSDNKKQQSSINSSTVLASLTQYTMNKPSVNSSTVLTSIITFVAKN